MHARGQLQMLGNVGGNPDYDSEVGALSVSPNLGAISAEEIRSGWGPG